MAEGGVLERVGWLVTDFIHILTICVFGVGMMIPKDETFIWIGYWR